MTDPADPNEFKLNTTTVTDVFGHFKLRDLARAAAAGQSDKVAQLVKAGADPNGRGEEGITPLFWAFFARNVQGMRALLDAGANPNLPMHMKGNRGGEWDEYLVVSAAEAESVGILQLLLEHGANPESLTEYRTPLTAAAGCLPCIKLLVEHGANVNREIRQHETVAIVASAIGHYDAIIYLLEHGYTFELDRLAWDVENRPGSARVQPKKDRILSMIATKGVKPFVPEWRKKELEVEGGKVRPAH